MNATASNQRGQSAVGAQLAGYNTGSNEHLISNIISEAFTLLNVEANDFAGAVTKVIEQRRRVREFLNEPQGAV